MMHDHGKSDRLIVPAKAPNEAEPGEAKEALEGEGVWPRGRRPSVTCPGHRAGTTCPARLSEYVRQRGGIKGSGSQLFCTTFSAWKVCAAQVLWR
jgi:hypothetical protein